VSLAQHIKRSVRSAVANVARPAIVGSLANERNFVLLQYPTALGTALHATPLVAALREAVPNCRIAVAASGFAREVFRNNPHIDSLIETPSPLTNTTGAVRAWRSQNPFRSQHWIALTTAGNERTRIAFASLLYGTGGLVGFAEAPEIYTVPLNYDPSQSLIANNLRIVSSLGHPVNPCGPQTFPSPADFDYARQLLRDNGVREGQMVAAFVTQTNISQHKRWRAERFAASAAHLIERYGARVVLVGTASEAKDIEALQSMIGPSAFSLAGMTNLLQLSAVLSLCRVGLTLDTGTMHLGRTVGLPMLIIAPAWSPPIEWLPVGEPRYRILKNLDMPTCPPDYIIDEVSVEEANAGLDELIAAYPGGAAGPGKR
jgi:ADP-heptose:LPS heptosyltransferase